MTGDPTYRLTAADLDRFVGRLRARLAAGAREYGDASFQRSAADLVDEVQRELADVCGGSLILWVRLDRLHGALRHLMREEPMNDREVRVRTWVRASDEDARDGLLGYLSVHYGQLVLDGITLRRTADDRYALSFPARTDRAGKRHSYIRPVDDDARREIEAEILWQLGEHEEFVP